MRTAILVTALLSAAGIAALTVVEVASSGFDVLSALSLLVVALFGFGIAGALRRPPEP